MNEKENLVKQFLVLYNRILNDNGKEAQEK